MRLTDFIDRGIAREQAFDGEASEAKARGFFVAMMSVFAAECLALAIRQPDQWIISTWVEISLPPLLLPFYLITGRQRLVSALLFGVILFRVVTTFPEAANHGYLLTLLFGLFALFDLRDPEERAWLLGTAKWSLVVVLFYSGLQKMLYGYYGQGEYFAYSIARYEHFRQFFSLILPAQEIERLASLQLQPGAGPFRLHSSLGVLISRGAYTAEMILPFLFLHERTRVAGVIGSILLIVLIEAAAREISFGLHFVNLTLLFAPGALNDRFKWFFAAAGAAMVVVKLLEYLQVLPGVHLL